MGGRATFLASLILPLACGVSYYGGGIADSQFFPGLLGRVSELQAPVTPGGHGAHLLGPFVEALLERRPFAPHPAEPGNDVATLRHVHTA